MSGPGPVAGVGEQAASSDPSTTPPFFNGDPYPTDQKLASGCVDLLADSGGSASMPLDVDLSDESEPDDDLADARQCDGGVGERAGGDPEMPQVLSFVYGHLQCSDSSGSATSLPAPLEEACGNDGSGHTSSGSDDNAAPDRAGKRLKTTRQSKRLTAEEKALRSERRKEATRLLNGGHAMADIFLCLDAALATAKATAGLQAALQADFPNVQTAPLRLAYSVEWRQRRWTSATSAPADGPETAQPGSDPAAGGRGAASSGKRRLTPEDLTPVVEDVGCVALLPPLEEVTQLVQADRFAAYLSHILSEVHPNKRLMVICEGTQQHFSRIENQQFRARVQESGSASGSVRQKRLGRPPVSRQDVDDAFAEARVLLGDRLACLHEARSPAATAQFLRDVTRYLAERPFKRPAAAGGGGRHRSARSPPEAWRAMLLQVPKMTEEAAEAVAKRYPSLAALYRAYEAPGAAAAAAELLKGLPVAPPSSGAAGAGRTLGPALARRLHAVLTATDPSLVL